MPRKHVTLHDTVATYLRESDSPMTVKELQRSIRPRATLHLLNCALKKLIEDGVVRAVVTYGVAERYEIVPSMAITDKPTLIKKTEDPKKPLPKKVSARQVWNAFTLGERA